jgi:hypothetical protein
VHYSLDSDTVMVHNWDMNNTYTKAVREVEIGDILIEADSFMWRVTATCYHHPRVTLSLVPVHPSMTAKAHDMTLHRSRNVRALQQETK